MAKGIKTGGRQKGTPNKRTSEFKQSLDNKGFCVPEKAMELFSSTPNDELKFKILEFLAEYSHSKVRPTEEQNETYDVIDVSESTADLLSLVSTPTDDSE